MNDFRTALAERAKPQAQARRSETQRRQQAARKSWKRESLPDWTAAGPIKRFIGESILQLEI